MILPIFNILIILLKIMFSIRFNEKYIRWPSAKFCSKFIEVRIVDGKVSLIEEHHKCLTHFQRVLGSGRIASPLYQDSDDIDVLEKHISGAFVKHFDLAALDVDLDDGSLDGHQR